MNEIYYKDLPEKTKTAIDMTSIFNYAANNIYGHSGMYFSKLIKIKIEWWLMALEDHNLMTAEIEQELVPLIFGR